MRVADALWISGRARCEEDACDRRGGWWLGHNKLSRVGRGRICPDAPFIIDLYFLEE